MSAVGRREATADAEARLPQPRISFSITTGETHAQGTKHACPRRGLAACADRRARRWRRRQTGGMPSDIEWKLAELGSVINPPETAKLYAPLQPKEPYQGVKVDARYQVRHARATPARPVRARGAGREPTRGADVRARRRLHARRPALAARQPVLRQHHAAGCAQRPGGRQCHLSPGAAAPVAGRGGGPRRGGPLGAARLSRPTAAIRPASS